MLGNEYANKYCIFIFLLVLKAEAEIAEGLLQRP